jgi:hypothetical protein
VKSPMVFLVSLVALIGLSSAYAQENAASDAANAFDKARAKAYGDVGTYELGFSGMGGGTSLSGYISSGGSIPAKSYSGNVSIFMKYFVAQRVHVGGAGLGNISLSYAEDGDIVGGNGMGTVIGQVGYAQPLTPQLQLDLTGGLGAAALFYTWTPIWALVFSGQAMFLLPVGENANIGLGCLVMGMNVKGTVERTTVDLKSMSANAIAQISIYF